MIIRDLKAYCQSIIVSIASKPSNQMQEYIQRGTTIGRGRMMAVTESGPGYGGVAVEMCKLS